MRDDCPTGKEHDPEPFVTYTMQTGTAGGWRGPSRFAPRIEYCQHEPCYRVKPDHGD